MMEVYRVIIFIFVGSVTMVFVCGFYYRLGVNHGKVAAYDHVSRKLERDVRQSWAEFKKDL